MLMVANAGLRAGTERRGGRATCSALPRERTLCYITNSLLLVQSLWAQDAGPVLQSQLARRLARGGWRGQGGALCLASNACKRHGFSARGAYEERAWS